MKHKTSELTGALLNAAVAKASGYPHTVCFGFDDPRVWVGVYQHNGSNQYDPEGIGPKASDRLSEFFAFCPSEDWGWGGPIIEREHIEISFRESPKEWVAWVSGTDSVIPGGVHESALVAAMRAYVASKFGEEVELPD